MRTPLRVLVAEDSETDAALLVHRLQRSGYDPFWERVEDPASMRNALERVSWDIVISDSSMPHFSAPAALAILREAGLDIPFVIVSGTIGEEAAVAAMRAGASDFLLKDNLARLAPVVERELRESKIRASRRKADEDLRSSEARYRNLFEGVPLPMWVFDPETLRFLAVNEAAVHHYGYSRSEFAEMTLANIRALEDRPGFREVVLGPADEKQTSRHLRKDGSVITVEIKAHDLAFENLRARIALVTDVTERRLLEEQLRQAQKMEAVGRLAGGIAHDFNNVLSVILSYSDLLLSDLKPGEPIRDDIEEIRRAATRAADLTRHLLMFSRQQVVEPKVLDLNEVLTSMDKMLQRILGADVSLVLSRNQPLGRVRIDRGSIEQVIMNLVVNARDAMPYGGRLSLETADVTLDEKYARTHHGVVPGPYVMLTVTDTGTGMDKATQARIFEPFFTTKELGRGTGLGLSTVFGIVQQGGGSIWVESEPGEGTTFEIYLPRVDASKDSVRPAPPLTMLRGSETVLLVEDEDQVRAVARGILSRSGYRVLEARNAGEALLQAEAHVGPIHLLLTDVVMPHVSGPDLAKRLVTLQPTMKILFMSGYVDDGVLRRSVVQALTAYVQKPITPEALTSKVREVLDASDVGSGEPAVDGESMHRQRSSG
jgi:two-component system, cell cycle sensor histidine kinase and response regulator CckA